MPDLPAFWGDLSTTERNLVLTAVLLLALAAARWGLLRWLQGRVEDAEAWYRTRKAATYTITVVAVIALGQIWLSAFGNIGTFLGILSAGIAIALSDVLRDLAGWAFILLRRPFRIGDRVEIDGNKGDVIDIRAFRFSLLEIGNWVDAEQSTGRILHVPNGHLFTHPMANYTEGFPYIWHEIGVLVTFESDWELAERIVREAIDRHDPGKDQEAARKIREAAKRYFIRYQHLTPTTYVTTRDSGVLITARLLVHARERRAIDDRVWRDLLHRFAAEPTVDLAYPTIRTYMPDPLRLRQDTDGG